MGYENGWCRPECTVCSEVCPTGAIVPIQKDEKLTVSIGKARVNLELCFAATDKEDCGNCERHCPTGAIRMIKAEGYARPVPAVAKRHCIGCGACEFLCPSRPISAIVVDGLSVHESDVPATAPARVPAMVRAADGWAATGTTAEAGRCGVARA